MRRALLACAGALLLSAGDVPAQVTGQATLSTAYRFRGEDLSDGRPALQGGLSYDLAPGLYAGALVTTAKLDPAVNTRLAAQFYGGYAHRVSPRWALEIGAVRYLLPSAGDGVGYNFSEAYLGATWAVSERTRVNSRIFGSRAYLGAPARALYGEFDLTRRVTDDVSFMAHVGYLGHRAGGGPEHPEEPAQMDLRLGVAWSLRHYTLQFDIVDSTATQLHCPAGTARCGLGAVVSVSRAF